MKAYTDVVIRIRAAAKDAPNRYPVEAQIDGSGCWRGESRFNFDALDAGKLDKSDYGVLLGQQLLNPSVARALEQAGAGDGRPVRIRLLLDEEISQLHRIRWERMSLKLGSAEWNVAISPDVPFSRYIPDERADLEPGTEPVFRLLIAMANPSDLGEDQQLDVDTEVANLVEEFGNVVPTARLRVTLLTGRTPLSDATRSKLADRNWKLVEGPASLDNISKALHRDGGYHALHMICHGNYLAGDGTGVLYLESTDGTTAEIEDVELQSWIHPRLRLVVFQACRTAATVPEGDPPFAGIAIRTVRFGVPAVIAMQDYVLMSDARAFAAALYRALLRDGYVDAAVNEARKSIPSAEKRVESTIPALFMRLRDGRLWQPDPVRSYVYDTSQTLDPPPALPLKVIRHSQGLLFDPITGPEGPVFTLARYGEEMTRTAWITILTGPPGFDKTIELERQFLRLGKAYLDATTEDAPVLLAMTELADWAVIQPMPPAREFRTHLQAVAQGRAIPPELTKRTFVFLVQSDRELSESASDLALDSLLRLLDRFPGSRAVVVYEENSMDRLRPRLGERTDVHLLVVRPLEWSALKEFLIAQGESELATNLDDRQIADLASTPWILARLREFARLERFAMNRAGALQLIFSSHMARFDTGLVSRACAENALERIAWEIQSSRAHGLDNADLVPILATVRGNRDFRLSGLRDELVRCRVLAPRGEEGVRFSYAAIQAYCAARYLLHSSRRSELLEDISATLGRYSRMRQWETVLIVLAGMMRGREDQVDLLQTILGGSSLAEGEQVFLAVCMYMEMDGGLAGHKVVKQIIDTLIWRSRPDIPRPYADRRIAAGRLADMRHPDAIRHLMALAVDQFTIASGNADHEGLPPPETDAQTAAENGVKGRRRYDNSGIRYIAVKGLLRQVKQTSDWVHENRPDLQPVVDAWLKLADGDTTDIVELLRRNDPALSPVAAFALAEAPMEIGCPPLVDVYFYFEKGGPRPDGEVLWAITELLGKQDSAWLLEHVILRWLKSKPAPNRRLCYLIQRLGELPPNDGVADYLQLCFSQERLVAQDRALRALSKLNDPPTREWLVPLCENIVRGDWAAVLSSGRIGLKDTPTRGEAWRLQQASLEVLRDIGSEQSIDVVRDARLRMDPVLFQLSFQVAEEIYWRLSGGLVRENYARKATA